MRINGQGRLVVNFRTEARFRGLFVLSHPGTIFGVETNSLDFIWRYWFVAVIIEIKHVPDTQFFIMQERVQSAFDFSSLFKHIHHPFISCLFCFWSTSVIWHNLLGAQHTCAKCRADKMNGSRHIGPQRFFALLLELKLRVDYTCTYNWIEVFFQLHASPPWSCVRTTLDWPLTSVLWGTSQPTTSPSSSGHSSLILLWGII